LSNDKPALARAALHFFEEPCVSGRRGSGAVFFCGCGMRCVFCQNYGLSRNQKGKELSTAKLADVFKALEAKGAHNINLVSPSHFAPQIMESLDIYRPKIPVIYNTSGYERRDTIARLSGYIDVYLTDLKYVDSNAAKELSGRPDYPLFAIDAIGEMIARAGRPVFDGDGMITSGVIIRHLVIPSYIQNSIDTIETIARLFKDDALISIMSQYTPLSALKLPDKINRRLKPIEYKIVLKKAADLGIDNAYVQRLSSAKEDYIPEFDFEGLDGG
jgi:putative pyruvate formate lyase activating enzyme